MKPHVLVVDDSVMIRMDLRSALTGAGFTVTACETRTVAQRVLKGRTFSLVILDVLLPDGDGLDLLRELRSTPDLMTVPIIVLSTEAEVRHRIQGFSVGADEYIGKPYDIGYLILRATALAGKHQSALASTSGGAAGALVGKKLLVVDDSPTYRATLAQVLRQDGCDVIPAQSGEEALTLLAVELVDCVIMDLLMPGIGGMEAARRIKASPATSHIPVVILTGQDDPATRAEGEAIGVDDFVIKSPELPLLKVRLRGLFRRKAGGSVESRPTWKPEPKRSPDEAPTSTRVEGGPTSAVPGSLLDQVVAASGLSSVIGPSTIARACRRAGVEPRSMSPADLQRALPTIQETMRLFLSADEYARSVTALALLVTRAAADGGVEADG
jgi:DNA-binding response OmpR family regulator